ncbi:MAG: hypothetical protein WAT93_03155 [Pontixanthobacter sp.]
MDSDVRLVRYEVLAANRRHFENLFFGVIAFSWLFSLSIWTALASLRPASAHVALAAAGAILIGGAFIAYRLLLRERASFDAMVAAWRVISGEPAKAQASSQRPGAMLIAAAGMAVAGCICILASLLHL